MPIHVFRGLLAFLLGFTLVWAVMGSRGHSATTLLPNGTQCFQQASGPLSSGSVSMLIPSTTTGKNTWRDANQSVLNTNPINLDANGCAVIYGVGQYRQQVYTGLNGTGTLLYDVLTEDTSAFNSIFWAGTAGGTPNAITVTDPGFNNTDGSVINFIALNQNTSSTTLNPGNGAVIIKVPSPTGPIALPSGCIAANNPISTVYSSSAAAFLLLTPCQLTGVTAAAAIPQPQGYLTLSSSTDSPIITGDVTGATTVYYTPYIGNQIPIWNGTSYSIFTFTQLVLTLSGSQLGNTLYDVCVFSNNGTPTLVTGPAWSNSGAGTSARGTGAGTTQLQRVNGLWVNEVQISGINGASTFTIPANQCTYLGTILINQTAGQVSNLLAIGQNRKWGVWNAYNRQPLVLQVADPAAGWSYATVTRASNGTSGNGATVLNGLSEESVYAVFNQGLFLASNGEIAHNGIGFNSTTTFSGMEGIGSYSPNSTSITMTMGGTFVNVPSIGVNQYYSLEQGNGIGAVIWSGTPDMLMTLRWRG